MVTHHYQKLCMTLANLAFKFQTAARNAAAPIAKATILNSQLLSQGVLQLLIYTTTFANKARQPILCTLIPNILPVGPLGTMSAISIDIYHVYIMQICLYINITSERGQTGNGIPLFFPAAAQRRDCCGSSTLVKLLMFSLCIRNVYNNNYQT